VREDLLAEPLEQRLHAAWMEHAEAVRTTFENGDYVAGAERYCAAFAQLVHDFFEEVFVNVDEEGLRLNRKSLLGRLYRLFAERFADLYLIETAEGPQH